MCDDSPPMNRISVGATQAIPRMIQLCMPLLSDAARGRDSVAPNIFRRGPRQDGVTAYLGRGTRRGNAQPVLTSDSTWLASLHVGPSLKRCDTLTTASTAATHGMGEVSAGR
jgi:hypothetical protein